MARGCGGGGERAGPVQAGDLHLQAHQLQVLARPHWSCGAQCTVYCRVVSTEGGSFTSARTLVQLYEDNKDLGQEIRYIGREVE